MSNTLKPEDNTVSRIGYLILKARGCSSFKVPVSDAAQASYVLCLYRDHHNLGSSDFTSQTGDLVDQSGRKVAKVSYNGRVWDLSGNMLWEPRGMTLSA